MGAECSLAMCPVEGHRGLVPTLRDPAETPRRASDHLTHHLGGSFLFCFQLEHNCFELPWWLSGKEFAFQCRRHWFDPWVGKILWRRKWQPTPVFLPGISHGQRSLAGYSPRGCKGLDMTERLNNNSIVALQCSVSFCRTTN